MPLHGDKGVIYFALNTETNLVKIGFTQQPKERKASLRRELGSELEYLKMVQSDTYLEIYIHEKFRHLRVEGEWFKKRTCRGRGNTGLNDFAKNESAVNCEAMDTQSDSRTTPITRRDAIPVR